MSPLDLRPSYHVLALVDGDEDFALAAEVLSHVPGDHAGCVLCRAEDRRGLDTALAKARDGGALSQDPEILDPAHLGGYPFDLMRFVREVGQRRRALSRGETIPVRLVGIMRWIDDLICDEETLLAFERDFNRALYADPIMTAAVCTYDVRRTPGPHIVGLLRIHPYVYMDGKLVQNVHYQPPADLAALG